MRFSTLMFALTLCGWANPADIVATQAASPTAQAQELDARVAARRPAIALHGNRLSVKIRNVPWAAVVQAMEHHTGITMRVQGTFTGTLTQEFEALPLERGLRRLFREANLVFFYTAGRGGAEALLTRVLVLPKDEYATSPQPALSDEATTMTEGEFAAEVEPRSSLEALYRSASEGKIEALREAILTPDPIIQAVAFDLLGEWDHQEAAALLTEAAKSDQPEVRLQALHLLHHTDRADTGTILTVLNEALTDTDVNVKGFALQALTERRGPDAMEDLRQALRDPNPSLRKMMVEDMVPIMPRELGLSLLEEALSDDDEMIRDLAAGMRQAIAEGR